MERLGYDQQGEGLAVWNSLVDDAAPVLHQ